MTMFTDAAIADLQAMGPADRRALRELIDETLMLLLIVKQAGGPGHTETLELAWIEVWGAINKEEED